MRLHVDGFTVCGVITGSFPTADAKFDPERNALQLALRVDESVRNALADVSPSVIGDASLTKLRIDNLADLEVQRPQNLIHGQHVFRVSGFCMVLTDEGAETYLENAMGTRFELAIDEVISKQLFKAHTAELLEGGDYKLVIKSRAGDAGGPLQTAMKRVKYLKVADPKTVSFTHYRNRDGETGYLDGHFTLEGENLDAVVQDTDGKRLVKVKNSTAGMSEELECACDLVDGKLVGKTGTATGVGDRIALKAETDRARTDVKQGEVTAELLSEAEES
ncbi:MAG: hypothetical protein Q4G65_10410 [bacterium]|nr:hypothetical protein [bacterium]